MVAFENLRLTGFKSFVEPTDMPILAGLTGIVGPNGCGKSNLVEALRWVMGESSAKRLRGGEMDDVIFAGAANRPARNQAEVSLRLANADFDAPLQFNDAAVIEVTRKVMRGQGSAYRVNGRDHRAQDLKLLFADLASGAASNAMVAQGRVSAIVNARPTDRRALLEEAAGITGLYSRRREAENRLRAAESNLERVDDLRQAKQVQRRTLERQASAARRYSALQAQARALAAALAYAQWLGHEAALQTANAALAASTKACEALSLAEAVAQREEAAASEAMEPRRLAHGEAAARLQRLELALESLATEERGLETKKVDLARQLVEVGDDLEREQGNVTAARERLEALAGEEAGLKQRRQTLKPQVATAEAALAEQEKQERAAGEAARQASLTLLAAQNAREALSRRIEVLQARASQLASTLARLETPGAVGGGFDGVDETAIAAQIEAQAALGAQLAAGQDARAALMAAQTQASAEQEAAREAQSAAQQAVQQARGEIEGLRAFLTKATRGQATGATLADGLALDPQAAKALAAVLGPEAEASLTEGSHAHWRPALAPLETAPAPSLPAGVTPLGAHVCAPDWLARALAHVGVVQSADEARALQGNLRPGQALTTWQGGYWRWDGFVAAQDGAAAAAALIERRQRLVDLEADLLPLEARLTAAKTQAETTRQALVAAQAALRAQDQSLEALNGARDRAGARIAQAQQALATHRAKIAAQEAERAGTAREQESVRADLREAQQALDAEGDLAALEGETQAAQQGAAQQGAALRQNREGLEALKRDLIGVDARLGAILTETFTFEGQLRNAERQFDVLAARAKALEAEGTAQAHRPQEIADKRFELQEAKQSAERARAQAGDALATAETDMRQARAAYTAAQKAYADAREGRARLTAEQSAAQDRLAISARAAFDQFKVPASDLLALTGAETAEALPSQTDASASLAKLERQIDAIGPVNLAAETEMEALAGELDRLQTEISELTQAIAKLRRVIGELNQEGRARLTAAFDQVATHFSTLFQRLFGGGKARLELTGSPDPLEAGLEIVASPPGKRLQSLTLLSGGEQTLTALALIFAMFRANPAPLCVLDEVDAPLDDANVERMCGLLEDMAGEVGTRFLIVTHNALTMARVDRLFGVTMAERGVSRLVSVDLQAATGFVDAGGA